MVRRNYVRTGPPEGYRVENTYRIKEPFGLENIADAVRRATINTHMEMGDHGFLVFTEKEGGKKYRARIMRGDFIGKENDRLFFQTLSNGTSSDSPDLVSRLDWLMMLESETPPPRKTDSSQMG